MPQSYCWRLEDSTQGFSKFWALLTSTHPCRRRRRQSGDSTASAGGLACWAAILLLPCKARTANLAKYFNISDIFVSWGCLTA